MTVQRLRLLDLFSGIGGFSLAAQWLGGFETVQFVEQEPYCQSILQRHWPNVPIHDDIRTFEPSMGSADVVCGGFPCQDISIAGKQAGIKQGTRSGLFYELMRVVRLVGPRYIVLENVSAILANGLGTVLGELAEAGFDAEWACIPASAVGACHQRDRWWLVAYTSGTDQSRRTEGFRRRFSSAANACSSTVSTGSRCADAVAHPSHLLSNGLSTEHSRAASCASVPKFGNSDGENAPNPYHQRRQEQHPAAVARGQGWTCWGDAPRRLNPDWRSYLSEPVLCRGDDGLSHRVDRLKALGNAVVPQVAMIPFARVLSLEHQAIPWPSGNAQAMGCDPLAQLQPA